MQDTSHTQKGFWKIVRKISLSPILPPGNTAKGKTIYGDLPLGGFGISRYELDYYLSKVAILNNCQIIQDTVIDIQFIDDEFNISTSNNLEFKSRIVLGAFGKRSNIDQKMNRNFFLKNSYFRFQYNLKIGVLFMIFWDFGT